MSKPKDRHAAKRRASAENAADAVDSRRPARRTAEDLRGISRLVIDAVTGVTNVVEDMHRNIAGLSPIVGAAPRGPARGISGFVYRSVRGVTRVVGAGLDTMFARIGPLLGDATASPAREAISSALNGVFGDYLSESGNPLAIPMELRRGGRAVTTKELSALATDADGSSRPIVVLVHGLCMNDLQWQRGGHDHGAALARDLRLAPVYLHYNSGRRVSENGREFADVLERLASDAPDAVENLVIIGHSMGGLVARSACHYARHAKHAWLRRLKKLVFLGTPHHGAPLERAGNWFNSVVEVSPYTAPFARFGKVRSAGVQDLRHGNLLDDDWREHDSEFSDDERTPVPLPRNVRCHAIAATKQAQPGGAGKRLPGDGLVPVDSALGRHRDAARALAIPPSRQAIVYGMNHFDLLGGGEVYEQLRSWLAMK